MKLLCHKMVSQNLSAGDDKINGISIIHNWWCCNECINF